MVSEVYTKNCYTNFFSVHTDLPNPYFIRTYDHNTIQRTGTYQL